MRDDLCVFVLSYGRAGNVDTVGTLERQGYTGDWYIIVDAEDQVDDYVAEYGEDSVIYLHKDGALPETDRGDNFDKRETPLYSRNQLWDVADDLGYDYFWVLDDDYTYIQYRFNSDFEYEPQTPSDLSSLDNLLDSGIKFISRADIDTLCLSQGGDFIGGSEASFADGVQTKRKAMNSFLCQTDRPFEYRGTMNDDVNTYVRAAQYGKLFLTTNIASVEQGSTQQNDGGITDLYKAEGTYVKSFYTILFAPSCTSLTKLAGRSADRIHHNISWRNAVPKIVPESTKKQADT